MAYTDIDKPSDYFNTKLWTGNGSTQSITGLDFQPDFVWYKSRSNTYNHGLFDSIRGASKFLQSNSSDAESTISGVTAFNSDGFSVGSDAGSNGNGATFAAWNWKAGTAFTNDASATGIGSIDSSGSVNQDAGFSIVSWTGSGADATIGHGLTQAPTIFIVKNRTDASTDWRVGQVLGGNIMTGGNGYYMELNATKASTNPGSATIWGSTPTAPTSSVFTVGSNNSNNGSSDNMIAYCFHSVKGYSKLGSYTGNGSTDGTFVYTGFKPAFVIQKNSSYTSNWILYDNKRDVDNVADTILIPNSSSAEASACDVDLLSNGFKFRAVNNASSNWSGNNYIYMAFAENPFVTSTGVPATAR